jgi:hypothetical protein
MKYNTLLVLAAFAPFVVAVVDPKARDISWKFLTFCACAQTVVLLAVAWQIAIIVWLIGWGCAVASRSSTRRLANESAYQNRGEGRAISLGWGLGAK